MDNKNCEDIHICSFCEKSSEEVDLLVAGPKDSMICSECIRLCESVLAEHDRNNICLTRIAGTQEKATKLRPITRMPKKWLVYDANPYAVIPYVTACDRAGKKQEDFSIPKQLANWILIEDKAVDIDELKEKIKKEIAQTVRASLKLY